MQFGPCHFIFGMYILNIKFSDTQSPYASLMVSDKVSRELFISIWIARRDLYVGSAFNWPWYDL